MSSNYEMNFCRNIGIFTAEEQVTIKNTSIAIAGTGGVGGLLAERMVRLGIGKLKLSDSGSFEQSNLNRQFGSSQHTIGSHKAEVVCQYIQDINSEAVITYDNRGIHSQEEADQLVDGCHLIIDEMDYGAWKESIYLQRAARKEGVHYIFAGAMGFGALVTNFSPHGITLEEYNGFEQDMDLKTIEVGLVSQERILPVMPSYARDAMSMEMIREIISGQRPVPTCSIGVGLASILAAQEVVNTILKRRPLVTAPEYIYVDLLDKRFETGKIKL